MGKEKTVQCVIAWTEESREWTGKAFAADLGERPELRDVLVPRACMWLNEATVRDVEAAKAYANREGFKVFTYTNEKDPIGAAKRDILRPKGGRP
jgi:hypothetical protein